MTRYEQAVEAIEKWLRNLEPEPIGEGVFTIEARALLSLADPSGLPWLVVRAEDQTMQVQGAIPALDAQEVMRQIRERGFVRVEQMEK